MFWERLLRKGISGTCPDWEAVPTVGKFRQSAVLVLFCGHEKDPRILLIRRPPCGRDRLSRREKGIL